MEDDVEVFTKDFGFDLPTKIEFGIGKINTLKEKLKRYGIERPLVVTDEGIKKAGILEEMKQELDEIDHKIFDGVEANPKDVNVEEGAEFAKEFEPDGIIAVGGGSPIDTAKGINVLLSEKAETVRGFYGKDTMEENSLPFIAIPTTSGTGSEVTFSAVITDTEYDQKRSLRSVKLAPNLAILDPELTETLPESLTAYSGMDAFTHAIEAYTAKTATPLTDSLALHSMQLIVDHLPRAVDEPDDMEARSAMLLASTLAGISFNNSDVASVHCMAEALGGRYDAPHGLCNSIILPYVMDYNKEYCEEKYARVAELMGYSFQDTEKGTKKAVEGVRKLNEEIGIPSIDETGLKESDIEMLAETSAKNLSNESNPRPMDKKDYVELFDRMVKDR